MGALYSIQLGSQNWNNYDTVDFDKSLFSWPSIGAMFPFKTHMENT